MAEVRWERMFPDQLEAAIEGCPIVYFAYGLCEPHGPQNALGLDTLKAHAICCQAAQKHGGIVAPADYWHIHEIGLYACWAAEVQPRLKEFKTMQYLGRTPPAADSRWRLNYEIPEL